MTSNIIQPINFHFTFIQSNGNRLMFKSKLCGYPAAHSGLRFGNASKAPGTAGARSTNE